MTKLSLAYAKIVATPTNTGWSQVYNAGSLFAVLSLTVIPDSIEVEEANLPAIGKELLNNLEAEFFTLEEKTFRSIEAAMEKSFNKIVPGITTDACLAYFKDDLLYLFILEKGKIIMKRDELLGLLLEKRADDPRLLTASGRLRQGDIILLQTDHFTQNITEQNITAAFELQLPNDIAESLSPHVHKKEDGSQAAIIIAYNGALPTQSPLEENIELVKEPIPAKTDNQPWPDKKPSLFSISSITKFLKRLKLPIPHLTKRQISALSLGIILLTLLIASIIFTKTQQENAKDEALFRQIYTQAQKNYDEGKALVKLNQNLAQDDFVKAEKILKENINKFKANSQQQIKLLAFLKQIETELNPTTPPIGKISPTTANVTELNFLNIEQKEQAMAFTQDNSSIYMLTDLAVTAIYKATNLSIPAFLSRI
ncbi:hypothetical protein KKE68_04615 [Patescibacteria group bacterium]|nr:hypothetical protein [Patescibacteria group bacterium]